MHAEDIKAALRKRGSSLTVIANQLRVSPSAVCHALHRPCSRRIEAALAKAIAKPPEELWPERYSGQADGGQQRAA